MGHLISNQISYFGINAIFNIIKEIKRRGFHKGIILTTNIIIRNQSLVDLFHILDSANLKYEILQIENSTKSNIANIKKSIKFCLPRKIDYLIAAGDNSIIDISKAIGLILNNDQFYINTTYLEGISRTTNISVPIIAIPTEFGASSESSNTYLLYDNNKKKKYTCIDTNCVPIVSIYDTNILLNSNQILKILGSVYIITNAIDGFISNKANQISDLYYYLAVKNVFKYLTPAINGDKDAINYIARAQYLTGLGQSITGSGLTLAMAYALNSLYDVDISLALSVLISETLRYNILYIRENFYTIAEAMNITTKGNIISTVEHVIDKLKLLFSDLKFPINLKEIGCQPHYIQELSRYSYDDIGINNNPKVVYINDIVSIFQACL